MTVPPSLSIIVPTIGRETLSATLDSIKPQLLPEDELIVIEEPYRGDWGNPSRDKGCAQATGDLLLFCDDDDVFTPNALEIVRREADLKRVNLFRMNHPDGILWADQVVRAGNVGTPMFCIPNDKAKLGKWTNKQGAISDCHFLAETLALHGTDPVFHEEVIALVRPKRLK